MESGIIDKTMKKVGVDVEIDNKQSGDICGTLTDTKLHRARMGVVRLLRKRDIHNERAGLDPNEDDFDNKPSYQT